VIALAILDVRRERSPEAWLLALWVVGTFVFAAHLNWVVNVRVLLPLVPAASILVVRRLDARPGSLAGARAWFAVLPGAALAFAVAHADLRWANGVRDDAERLSSEVRAHPGRAYFLGHWGLQHALEARGLAALDVERDELLPGDVLVLPTNNIGVFPVPSAVLHPARTLEGGDPGWIRTVDPAVGAGFYSSHGGPLPFVFARSQPDAYQVAEVRRRFRVRATWR
jgi:hypothetical protein